MKKIYLALLALGFAFNADAQSRKLSLEVEVTNPIFEQDIKSGTTIPYEFTLKNVSKTAGDSLVAGDTLFFIDPFAKRNAANDAWEVFGASIILENSLLPGSSLNISFTTPPSFNDILTLADPADGLKYKKAPFTNNKKYVWFSSLAQIRPAAGSRPLDVTSEAKGDTLTIWINKSGVSIEESMIASNTINTFPNPAVNTVGFEYNFAQGQAVNTRIMDAFGRLVAEKQVNGLFGTQKVNLDVTTLANGAYFLQVIDGDKTMTSKFNVVK
jgi:hypothetical protein